MENKLKEAESKISQLIALDSILDSQLEFLRSQFLSASNGVVIGYARNCGTY